MNEETGNVSGGSNEWLWEKLLPFYTLALLVVVLFIASSRFRAEPLDNILTVLNNSSIFVVAAA